MNIVFCIDNKYVNLLLFTLSSLIRTQRKDSNINVYILSLDKIKHEYLHCFDDELNINIIDGINALDKYNINEKDKAKFLKFCIPNILVTLDDCLYLDTDIIINKDLKDFYDDNNIKLKDKLIAASKDHWQIYSGISTEFRGTTHFNTGVIQFNLNKCRDFNLLDKGVNYYLENGRHKPSGMLDQPIFNAIILPSNIVFFSCLYNLIRPEIFLSRDKKKLLNEYNELFNLHYNNFDDLIKDSYVYHMAGKDKNMLLDSKIYLNESKLLDSFIKTKTGLDVHIECKTL